MNVIAPHLVLAVVILRVPEDSVAESEHVLVGSILLVGQLLQTQQRTFPSWPVLKGGLQDAEDLMKTHKHTLSESWKSFRAWCLYYLMLHSEGVRGNTGSKPALVQFYWERCVSIFRIRPV